MNGFPYGGFHNTRVKDQVHAPDWTTTERVEYTLRLFHILESLVPEGMDGGVSTSPFSYRHWFDSEESARQARDISTTHVLMVAEELASIHRKTGKVLHLDIEPEPDGMLESGEEFMQWFESDLIPAGVTRMGGKFQFSAEQAEASLKEHVRLCYDVCHFAIGYEDHRDVLARLEKKGIKIGKFQISAALKAKFENGQREVIRKAFAGFNENTYLHQVVAKTNTNQLIRYADLPEALDDFNHTGVEEWRAHYHVPVSADHFGALQSTHNEIEEVISLNKLHAYTTHLEVETYTWEVMPSSIKQPLQQSITSELAWVNRLLKPQS
jgi:hypothetical protein